MCPLTGRIFLKEKLVIFFGQFLSNFDLNGFLRGYLFFTSSPFNRFCSNLTEMCAMIMRNFFFLLFGFALAYAHNNAFKFAHAQYCIYLFIYACAL